VISLRGWDLVHTIICATSPLLRYYWHRKPRLRMVFSNIHFNKNTFSTSHKPDDCENPNIIHLHSSYHSAGAVVPEDICAENLAERARKMQKNITSILSPSCTTTTSRCHFQSSFQMGNDVALYGASAASCFSILQWNFAGFLIAEFPVTNC